ncbi:MAG: AraC family transcriptional regulator [PVC group bacterium]
MKTETKQIYHERILRVLIYIQRHLEEPLDLNELAAIACFSPFHFHRIFRGLVGESVKEHIRRLRLERAVYRLRSTDQSILWIALDAGYETHESFTRAFKSMFGEAPSAVRKGANRLRYQDALSGVRFEPDGRLPKLKTLTRGGRVMKVKIVRREPTRVAFVRYIGPYEECEEAWGKLCAWAGPRGLLGPHTDIIGISYDDPEVTPPEKIRYDACIVVDGSLQPEGEVGVQVIPGGEYAVTTHQGPYLKLIDTYSKLFGEWAPQSGRVVASGPCLELYRNDPHRTPPQELLTDVCVPLEAE